MNSSHHRDAASGQRLTPMNELVTCPPIASAELVEGGAWEEGSTLDRLYSSSLYWSTPFPPDHARRRESLRVQWQTPSGDAVGHYPLDWLHAHVPSVTSATCSALDGLVTSPNAEEQPPDAAPRATAKPPSAPAWDVSGLRAPYAATAVIHGAGLPAAVAPGVQDHDSPTLKHPPPSASTAAIILSLKEEGRACSIPRVSLSSLVSSPAALTAATSELVRCGAMLLSGCGSHDTPAADAGDVEATVARVAGLFGYGVQPTLYGPTFTVESTSNPINAAYSPCFLEGHQDLAYYESAPGLQLLHCTRFDAALVGGESLLLDLSAVAEALRRADPRAFVTLATVPVTLQKVHYAREEPAHMIYRRPAISVAAPAAMGYALGLAAARADSSGLSRHASRLPSLEDEGFASLDGVPEWVWAEAARAAGKVTAVAWAPPFEGALRASPAVAEEHFSAVKVLWAALDECQRLGVAADCLRLQEGEMLVFNNRRLLHGRMSFGPDPSKADLPVPAGGLVRRLRGAYVNIDEFQSRHESHRGAQRGSQGASGTAHLAQTCHVYNGTV